MIIIDYEYIISQEIENTILKKEFEKFRNKPLNKNSLNEISLIYKLIEQSPTPEFIEEIIFTNRKYHLLIKHDSLIRAIELGYFEILNKVVLFSSDVDLIKTAINYVNDNTLLQLVVMGVNLNLSNSKNAEIKNRALMRITDKNVFCETFTKAYSKHDYEKFFKKIKHKSNYKTLSKFQQRLIPQLISLLPNDEVYIEFARKDKYPKFITDLVVH